ALMLHLCRSWRRVPLARRRFLFASGTCRRSAGTPIKAHAIYGGGGVYHGRRVNVANIGHADIAYGFVVIVLICSSITALVAATGIAIAIGNAAIEADDRTPVAGVPIVQSLVESPVTRCPKQARFRSEHPRARHPVIPIISVPSPVARLPEVAFGRANRL